MLPPSILSPTLTLLSVLSLLCAQSLRDLGPNYAAGSNHAAELNPAASVPHPPVPRGSNSARFESVRSKQEACDLRFYRDQPRRVALVDAEFEPGGLGRDWDGTETGLGRDWGEMRLGRDGYERWHLYWTGSRTGGRVIGLGALGLGLGQGSGLVSGA